MTSETPHAFKFMAVIPKSEPMSKLSIASLIILGAGVLLTALTVAIVFIDNTYIAGATGRPYSESLTAVVLLFSSYALPALSILGGGLGIAGLLYFDRGDRLAWLSVVGNAVILVLVCTILVLTVLLEGYGATP